MKKSKEFTEKEFIKKIKYLFKIIKPQTNEIKMENCFCCRWGNQFTETQIISITKLGLMEDGLDGEKNHLFLGGLGVIHKHANFFLKEKLALEDGEYIDCITQTENGLTFSILRKRSCSI